MTFRFMTPLALLLAGLTAGCANDGGLLANSLTTASVAAEPKAQVATAPKVDPQCFVLMTKIEQLRKEGAPARLEKVATGKGATANVKRDTLAKMTELDKANAEFQTRCSNLSSPPQAAAAAAATPAAPAAAAAASPAAPAKATQTVAKAAAAKTTAAAKPVAQ